MSVSLLLKGVGAQLYVFSLASSLIPLVAGFFFFFLLSPCWLKNVIDILSASSHLPFYFILLVLYLSSLTQNSCRRIPFLKVFFFRPPSA